MQYEPPRLKTLRPAVDAIQAFKGEPYNPMDLYTDLTERLIAAYEDWE
jgi:hypothetical protein